jgi:hypothetical protein
MLSSSLASDCRIARFHFRFVDSTCVGVPVPIWHRKADVGEVAMCARRGHQRAADFYRQDFGTSRGSSKIQLIPISVVCGRHRDFKQSANDRAGGHAAEPRAPASGRPMIARRLLAARSITSALAIEEPGRPAATDASGIKTVRKAIASCGCDP